RDPYGVHTSGYCTNQPLVTRSSPGIRPPRGRSPSSVHPSACTHRSPYDPRSRPMAEATVPFRAGQDGYAGFRTPAVLATGAGPLLASCEGRVDSSADHGHIDIVLKRSTDGGRTWGALQVAASNGENLAGNPAPVVLDTGRILLVHIRAAASATEDAI